MAKEYTQLTEKERYHLELLLQGSNSYSQNEIARILGRAKSTISREIKRNIKVKPKVWKKRAKRISISERPEKDILKEDIGNWEGDTIEGKGHRSGLGTFVDMKSKYVIIRKLRDKSSIEMKNALVGSFLKCPDLINTLTVDNGGEFALHDEMSAELKTKVYFSSPYSPWERGLNENTNGLIRRFYPKGTDFNKIPE